MTTTELTPSPNKSTGAFGFLRERVIGPVGRAAAGAVVRASMRYDQRRGTLHEDEATRNAVGASLGDLLQQIKERKTGFKGALATLSQGDRAVDLADWRKANPGPSTKDAILTHVGSILAPDGVDQSRADQTSAVQHDSTPEPVAGPALNLDPNAVPGHDHRA